MARPSRSDRRSRSLDDPRPSGLVEGELGVSRAGGHVGLPSVGSKFGRWRVIAEGVRTEHGWYAIDVQCECGNEARIPYTNLLRRISGECRSCAAKRRWGLARIIEDDAARTHWINIHKNIITRCYDESGRDFRHYGGRGITVDESLIDSADWLRFVVASGWVGSEHLTVDRIDVNGNYVAGNLRLATMAEQNENKRAPNGYAAS
jgi:hypothetical protein